MTTIANTIELTASHHTHAPIQGDIESGASRSTTLLALQPATTATLSANRATRGEHTMTTAMAHQGATIINLDEISEHRRTGDDRGLCNIVGALVGIGLAVTGGCLLAKQTVNDLYTPPKETPQGVASYSLIAIGGSLAIYSLARFTAQYAFTA